MSKAVTVATALVLAGAHIAYAQVYGPCTVEAATTQQECLATGNPAPECAVEYQQDISECYAYGNGPIGGPVFSRGFSAPRRVSAPRSAPRAAPHAAPRSGPAHR
jgi:hypothetical protein